MRDLLSAPWMVKYAQNPGGSKCSPLLPLRTPMLLTLLSSIPLLYRQQQWRGHRGGGGGGVANPTQMTIFHSFRDNLLHKLSLFIKLEMLYNLSNFNAFYNFVNHKSKSNCGVLYRLTVIHTRACNNYGTCRLFKNAQQFSRLQRKLSRILCQLLRLP